MLRKSQMRLAQKASIGAFLCLSCVMVVASITRLAGMSFNDSMDITWEIYWTWVEGCVAVIMASAVAFRTLFIQDHNKNPAQRKPAPFPSIRHRFQHNCKRSHQANLEEGDLADLPQIPTATFSGLRGFIRRHNRSAGETTILSSECDIVHDTMTGEGQGEMQIYHSVEWDIRSDRLSEHRPPRPFPFTVPVERELGLARGF